VAHKQEQLTDPRLTGFYLTLGHILDWPADDPRLVDLADDLAAYITQIADEQGEDYIDGINVDPPFTKLMDALAFDTVPPARRLIELLKKRGWGGWTKLVRVDPPPSG
jgi:hypothetical protein